MADNRYPVLVSGRSGPVVLTSDQIVDREDGTVEIGQVVNQTYVTQEVTNQVSQTVRQVSNVINLPVQPVVVQNRRVTDEDLRKGLQVALRMFRQAGATQAQLDALVAQFGELQQNRVRARFGPGRVGPPNGLADPWTKKRRL